MLDNACLSASNWPLQGIDSILSMTMNARVLWSALVECTKLLQGKPKECWKSLQIHLITTPLFQQGQQTSTALLHWCIQVIPSSFFFRVFGTPPESSLQKTVLVHDHHNSFSFVLFYGQELRLFTFEMLLFCVLDTRLGSPGLAAGVAYALVILIRFIRARWGEVNLAAKTLVDQHFLV